MVPHFERVAADLAQVSAQLRHGEGTLGALVQDPTVYQQLVTILGGVGRSRVLRALVRYAISKSDTKEADGLFTRCPTDSPRFTKEMFKLQHRGRGMGQAFHLVSFSVDLRFRLYDAAGTPSITLTRAWPCDSPAVVKRSIGGRGGRGKDASPATRRLASMQPITPSPARQGPGRMSGSAP